MVQKSIGIIGAGIGGLTSGAILSRQGYKVEIFEKESILGGRALSLNGSTLTQNQYNNMLSRFNMRLYFSEPSIEKIFEKNMLKGYTFDLGFHLIGGGAKSAPLRILKENKKNINMLGSRIGRIEKNDIFYPFLSFTDKIRILPRAIQLLISRESTFQRLDTVPVSDAIKMYGRGKMALALELFSRAATTVNDLSKISSGETLRSKADFITGLIPVGYPVNGIQSLSNAFAEIILNNNGKINLSQKVDQVIIEKNKAKEIVINNENKQFDKILSNIPVQNIFKVINEKYFPEEYVNRIKKLKGTGSVCAYYSLKKLDENLIGKTFIFIERDTGVDGNDAVGMIDFMTASPKAGLSPKDAYLIQAYIICTPEEAKNNKMVEKLKNILDKWMEKICPDFSSKLNWALYPIIWHLDGVAKTIDSVKPDIKTPIDNLYFVGDCVKAPGIGYNCAVNSARILSDILMSQ